MKGDSDDSIRFTPDVMYASERDELLQFAHEQFEMLFDVLGLAKSSNAPGAKVTTIGKTTRATVFSTSRIQASLSEVKDIFNSEHTHYATGFAQTQQIYSLLTQSNTHPMRSAAVRWSLWNSPSKMTRKRDIVYVEYMDSFVDDYDRKGWARCTHSIEHRSCPPLENSHNVVRAHLYCSGSTYTETDEPGVLEVTTVFDIDTRGVPAWLSKIVALRKAESAANVEHLIRLSRVMTDEDDPEIKLIDINYKGKVCCGCGDRLSKWSAPRKCRECKEPLCKSCSDVVYYNSDERKKLKHICIYCADNEIADGEQRGEMGYSGGLDPIFEKGAQCTRRLHHMSFRSLRMARENFAMSPTFSSGRMSSSISSSSSSSSRYDLNGHRSILRAESDPALMSRPLSQSSRLSASTSSLRSAAGIAV